MSSTFPSKGFTRKFASNLSDDDALNTLTITVPSTDYGILWKLWVSIDVASETDLENLNATQLIKATVGASVWSTYIHPFIAHTDTTKFRHVDLGPWREDFGVDGLYSGVRGDNVVVTVTSMGTGVKSDVMIIYSGD